MKAPLAILAFSCATLSLCADDSKTTSRPPPNKYVVEYARCIPEHCGWTLYHIEALNSALARFLSRERGLNTKCLVIPAVYGYDVLWMRSDWEDPISEEHKNRAEEIIRSYLSGADGARISREMTEANPPNQPTQRNAGSRPSSGDSPASETPSSLGPRG